MSSSQDDTSSERDYFATADDLLQQAAVDGDVRDDLATEATVVNTEQRVFTKTEQSSLFAAVEINTAPLSPDEYHRATTDYTPLPEKYSQEPEQYTEQQVPFVEYDVSPKACSNCSGTGAQMCVECHGEGDILCTECNTTGDTNCQTCSGAGRIQCTTCGQSGYEDCAQCNGNGQCECPKCAGKPSLTCSCVDQPGQVGQVLAIHKEAESAGVSTQSRSQQTETTEAYLPCQRCDGSGNRTCGVCDGGGTIDCKRCGGSQREICPDCRDGWQRCPDCGGQSNQECRNCAGRGREVCPDCTGQGEHACEECDHTGELYYAQHGVVTYTTDTAVEWEQDDSEMIDAVGNLKVKQIKAADGAVVQDETSRPEAAPAAGATAEVRRRTLTTEIPTQKLTYEYNGDRGTITEIDGDIDSEIVTSALTERGKQKRKAAKIGAIVFSVLLVGILIAIVAAAW